MKKLFIFLGILLFNFCNAFAQVPQKMSFQAVIRNSSNALVSSSSVGMKISILQGSAMGTIVYAEKQTPFTNANGLVSIEIGSGDIILGSFSSIDWANGPYFIKTEADPNGGSAYTISGTSELMSVPYALFSANGTPGPAGPAGPVGPPGLSGFVHYIGELYGGGIVVSVWKENGVEKGLVASLKDLAIGIQWSNVISTSVGGGAQSPIDGATNTDDIIAQAGHIYSAAKLCKDYVSGGYSDWYLPAAWELNQCYNVALIVNSVLGSADGFYFGYYMEAQAL
jgi:hypothetical protein